MTRELVDFLLQFVTDEKRALMLDRITHRTRHLTVVLEDIYQSHNASAVLRSCDCFGIQDVHIIENQNRYRTIADVALGSSQWLTLSRYNAVENNTEICINQLKAKGYRIVGTSPHGNSQLLSELDITSKTALLFGTEMRGLTDTALEMVDETVRIPQYGFTESLNISVSAAICLYTLSEKLRTSNLPWALEEPEANEILVEWAKQSLKKPELLLKEFYENQQ